MPSRRASRWFITARSTRIDFEGEGDARRAVGARTAGSPRPARARGRTPCPTAPFASARALVIVAAGAIESPALLQRSGHPDPHGTIGRGLVLHPSLGIVGIFDHDVDAGAGIEGTMYSDHFVAGHGFFLQCLFAPLGAGAATLPGFGPAALRADAPGAAARDVRAMLLDSVDADNRVVWDAGRRSGAHLLPAVAGRIGSGWRSPPRRAWR